MTSDRGGRAYYNENDPKTAAWLRELIKQGLVADGEVDTRSIVDVRPADLAGFIQCHFFAGIGGWSYALRLAGWSDDRAVWTGSCPCQPFSSAGRGDGADDSRHLWPTWFRLVSECRPGVVFGEQVASADGLGWLDRVSTDLEAADYAVGAVDLCAASVGAFHIRQRLWFVADANGRQSGNGDVQRGRRHDEQPEDALVGVVADAERWPAERRRHDVAAATGSAQGRASERQRVRDDSRDGGDACELADSEGARGRSDAGAICGSARARVSGAQGEDERRTVGEAGRLVGSRAVGCVGNACGEGLPRIEHEKLRGAWRRGEGGAVAEPSAPDGFWADADWIDCTDGKARPVEPGTFPLAHGLPARVGRLRGYGNAIVPQVAAEVIAAYMEIANDF